MGIEIDDGEELFRDLVREGITAIQCISEELGRTKLERDAAHAATAAGSALQEQLVAARDALAACQAHVREANAAIADAEERGYKRGLGYRIHPNVFEHLCKAFHADAGAEPTFRPRGLTKAEWLYPEEVKTSTEVGREILCAMDHLYPKGFPATSQGAP